ncbi:MarR family transcriptional regulator, partial [Staphylococcus cohnii]
MDKENVIKSVIQLIQTKESNNNHSFLFDNDISLSLTQLHILDIISSEENVNNQRLKEKLKISAPAVTKATKKLNQIGCIFEDKSQDNKKIYYRLTNK